MKIITVYAVVNNGSIITTTKNEKHAYEQAEILNTANKTKDYIVVPCNGLVI